MSARFVAIVLLVLAEAGVAHARVDAAAKEVAHKAAVDGRLRYEIADYEGALVSYQRAYDAAGDPALLFDLAECHRRLGQRQAAVEGYRQFLERSPPGPRADEARAHVALLSAELTPAAPLSSATTSATTNATTLATSARRDRPLYQKWWFWTATVGGAAGVAVALGVGIAYGRPHETVYQVHVP